MRNQTLVVLLSFALAACGQSPLLNHRSSNVQNQSTNLRAQNQTDNTSDHATHLSFDKIHITATLTGNASGQGELPDPFLLHFSVNLEDLGYALSVLPWMPGHGHSSRVIPTVINHGSGKYEVNNIILQMHGHWEFHFQIKKDGELVDESMIAYETD